MISLRRSSSRRRDEHRDQVLSLTFFPGGAVELFADGFFTLRRFNESHLRPGGRIAVEIPAPGEIVTYVRLGDLTHVDSVGHTGVLRAGEMQRRAARADVQHRETNDSRDDWVHLFQVVLKVAEGAVQPDLEQRSFSAADRRGALLLVAGHDFKAGSLRVDQDARIYSALLERGHHVIHELAAGRAAWLHVVDGAVTMGDVALSRGDGVGITAELGLSFTARTGSEVLLVDLAEQRPTAPGNGSAS